MTTLVITTSDGTKLAVRVSGDATAATTILQLSGGPGCVNYLSDVEPGFPARVVTPDPRGDGDSHGGPHDTATALADLEDIRRPRRRRPGR